MSLSRDPSVEDKGVLEENLSPLLYHIAKNCKTIRKHKLLELSQ